jgi:hypothetical protein
MNTARLSKLGWRLRCRDNKPLPPQTKSQYEANQCHEAKERLLEAENSETLEQASRKVKILCQF